MGTGAQLPGDQGLAELDECQSPPWRGVRLFGNGKTALKVSLGRFTPYAIAAVDIPADNQAASTTRTWNDNGNYVPDCDLRNPVANGECGPWSDLTFGQVRAGNTRRAADALRRLQPAGLQLAGVGFLQHELRPNVALNVGYFRTWYGDFLVTDNQARHGGRLRSVLRHGAEGHAAARRRRQSDLRSLRRQAGGVRPRRATW